MSDYTSWHVGMKVVCLDDNGRPYESEGFKYPKQNGVYTVREIVHFQDVLCILLCEIINPGHSTTNGFREPGFNIKRFRRVQHRKTSIAIFNRILLNPGLRIEEDA